jgi:hypothetical protein
MIEDAAHLREIANMSFISTTVFVISLFAPLTLAPGK